MMREITSALWRFWGQFVLDGQQIPVYQAGTVPADAAFPYITFEAPRAEAFGVLPLTAFLWVKYTGENSASAIAQRLAWWEAVEQAIPEGGVKLPLSVGFLMIHRGSGDFLYPGADDEDKTVLFGRVGYDVTYYTR